MNMVVLQGRLTRPAELRLLPSGDRLVALELSVQRPGQKARAFPLSGSRLRSRPPPSTWTSTSWSWAGCAGGSSG